MSVYYPLIMCFTKGDTGLIDELYRPIDNFLLYESLWNDKCDYIQPDSCTNLNVDNYNLIILQLNIRGLISHQSELKLLIQKLNKKTQVLI